VYFCVSRVNYYIGGSCVYYGALHGFAASPIAFISHERKPVVIQFLSILFVHTWWWTM